MPELIKETQERYPTKTIQIWLQDEARIGQQGTVARLWAATGTRPRVFRDCRFKSAYIFAAICPELKKIESLVFTNVGAEEMSAFLRVLSSSIPESDHVILVLDRAPWHRSVIVPNNISLVYLPPYSPELNPVEQIWDFLRSNYLSHRVYETLDDIFAACCQALNSLADLPDIIHSIGTRSYFSVIT